MASAISTDIALATASALEKRVSVAFASLMLYDHAICLGEEKGSVLLDWSMDAIEHSIPLDTIFGFGPRNNYASRHFYNQPHVPSAKVSFTLSKRETNLENLPAVITLRVWYLFSRSPAVRSFAVTAFALTTLADFLVVGLLWSKVKSEILDPSATSASPVLAWVYVPSLFIHSTLFGLKVYRFVTSPTRMQTDTLLWRFMKEGMFMYAFAMVSLTFGIIGLAITSTSELPTHLAALTGSPVVASIVVSVCRAMLSIRSLAATGHVEPAWLLNHAELSRVHWRRGAAEGEIIVGPDETAIQLPILPASTAESAVSWIEPTKQ
ncbi:hypothetical protein HYDPIDRAFT_27637 [Hydnomerulius pinastri MD-312]|nr:hypothetical protein HYDPIDRAFT_27637 [Hydnomerulius pinastri MD-312]